MLLEIMAMGFSGSNGGIAEAYRRFEIADIEAGLQKYKTLYKSAPAQVKPKYAKLVKFLAEIYRELKESSLVEKTGA